MANLNTGGFDPSNNPVASLLQETIATPKLRSGGPSSSGLLNNFLLSIKRAMSMITSEVVDCSDQARVFASLVATTNKGLSQAVTSLQSQVAGLTSGSSALADLYLCQSVIPGASTCDINPRYGQATLPVNSRVNVLTINRGQGEPPAIPSSLQILYAKTIQTSFAGVTPPSDPLFSEDPYWVYAVDGREETGWVVTDSSPYHVVWIEIRLPNSVSNAYSCNELEFIPSSPFSMQLFSVLVEQVGVGWQSLDFSYLSGYNATDNYIPALGPSRLCFSQTNATRFRIGLMVSGTWGFQKIAVNSAQYQSSAVLATNFSSYSPGTIQTIQLYGKNPQTLSYFQNSLSGDQVTTTLIPTSSNSETPVISGVGIFY